MFPFESVAPGEGAPAVPPPPFTPSVDAVGRLLGVVDVSLVCDWDFVLFPDAVLVLFPDADDELFPDAEEDEAVFVMVVRIVAIDVTVPDDASENIVETCPCALPVFD